MVHGPKTKITQGIVTDNALNIAQNANAIAINVTKTNTGDANCITIDNSGSGFDIRGSTSNWSVDKNGNAVFNTVAGVSSTAIILTSGGVKTISSGVITVNSTSSRYTVDTEGAAASDDLDTINGGTDGQVIIITAENDARTVVVTENGNVFLDGAANSLDSVYDTMTMMYLSAQSKWVQIAFSSNAV